MNIQKLEELLNRSEGEKLDFKQEFRLELESCKKEFAKDVCAIANAKGGRGYIIFGVEDKTKEVIGVTTKVYDEERVQQLLCSRLDPPVPVRLEEIIYHEKKVVVLTIFKSEQRPHQVLQTGTFYIRRGSTSDIARRYEIASMLQENGLVSWEKIIQQGASLDALDWGLMRCEIAKNLRKTTRNSLLLLEGLGILGMEGNQFYPTMGGILLFGKNTSQYFPSAGVHIETKEKSVLLEGNIITVLKQAETIITDLFKHTQYPIDAVYEALYNALVHRDYWDSSREVYVGLFPKKVEIMNPGAISRGEGQIYIEDEITIPRRNQWLYQRLLFFDHNHQHIHRLNGLHNLKDCFPSNGNDVKLVNLPRRNLFKVVLPGLEDMPL